PRPPPPRFPYTTLFRSVRAIRSGGYDAALALALTDPVVNALAGARLREVARTGALPQEFSLAGEEQHPEGLLWHGVNLAPQQPRSEEHTSELQSRFDLV